MGAIPFTERELRRAWSDLIVCSKPSNERRKNSHRLLLFYAVECGLKAVWLRRNNRTVFEQKDIDKTGHDLRKLLKDLRVGNHLSLPEQLTLSSVNINGQDMPRRGNIAILHQAWRYGGQCTEPSDEICEQQLLQIIEWVKGELR